MASKKVIRVGQVSALPQGCMINHACDCKIEGRWADMVRNFRIRYGSRYSSRFGSKLSIRRLAAPIPAESAIDVDELAFENLLLKATIEAYVSPEMAEAFDEALYKRFEAWEPTEISEEGIVALVKEVWDQVS